MLKIYRALIVAIDFFLITLLSCRTRIVLLVGKHKKENNIAITDYEVENKKRIQVGKWAEDKKVGKKFNNFAGEFLQSIMDFSKQLQDDKNKSAEK